MSRRKRLALVIPRFGSDIFGGEVALAASIAKTLQTYADVQILTTCARDYMTWHNEYRSGYATVDGIKVRRFRVDHPRNVAAFDAASRRLLEGGHSIERQEAWMRLQGPNSRRLAQHIETFAGWYDSFVFFSYLYATSYFLLPLVEERAALFPLAHDEWPIHFGMWDRFFERPKRLVFCSEGERAFVMERFLNVPPSGMLFRYAVQAPADVDPQRFRARYSINERFALYIGRVDPSKGCEELVVDFARYYERGGKIRRLIVAGEPHMGRINESGISSIGALDDQAKWDALAACHAVIMPSRYESLSISMLEAWASGKPVVCSAYSRVLADQCRRAGGGLWYSDDEELAAILDMLADGDLAQRLGENGRTHVSRQHDIAQSTASLTPLLAL